MVRHIQGLCWNCFYRTMLKESTIYQQFHIFKQKRVNLEAKKSPNDVTNPICFSAYVNGILKKKFPKKFCALAVRLD